MNRHKQNFALKLSRAMKHEQSCKLRNHGSCKNKMTHFEKGIAMGFLQGYKACEDDLKILIETYKEEIAKLKEINEK